VLQCQEPTEVRTAGEGTRLWSKRGKPDRVIHSSTYDLCAGAGSCRGRQVGVEA